jgi:outer membrane receptor protein involved in Fe transport
VKNGPQSITGQINVEYVKPEDEPSLQVNIYGDSRLKGEANVMGNVHLNHHLSTEVLAHYEKDFMHMDEDGDGWHDSPALEQLHLQNRWYYAQGRYIMHAGFGFLHENREGGQMKDFSPNPYRVMIEADRLDAYMKHALLLDAEHNTNLALLATSSLYNLDGSFGTKEYSDRQRSLNTQLVLEHDFNDIHNLSTGLSFNLDRLDEKLLTINSNLLTEYTPGVYVQYTYKPNHHLTAMAGLRADRSSLYSRTYLTPRLHIKWLPVDWFTLRGSVGKGYRTPYALAEHHYLLTSGRTLMVNDLQQEEAWNSGLSCAFYIPLFDRTLTLNAEYYYTDFINQAVVDYDSDPTAITIDNLNGSSYSHTLQVDANYDLTEDLNALVAFRYNRVMSTYGGQLMEKPLQSRYKGLVTLSWKPMLALWQVDFTLQLNGGGRVPAYIPVGEMLAVSRDFPAYLQLNLQLTREFRHFSLYIGGENLTNYRQKNPVINAANPWSSTFDPTLVWGPVHGIMAYAGIRLNL